MSEPSATHETPSRADFAQLVTALEERTDSLYSDLSELETFARLQAQSNGSSGTVSVAASLRLGRSFTYQTFRILRQLSGHLAGLPIANQPVDATHGSMPPCCPAWSLAAAYWIWMRSPGEPEMLVQPSVVGSDGTLLPIVECPFCTAKAPSRMRADELGRSVLGAPAGTVDRIGAIARSLMLSEGEEDEDTAEVPDA